MSWNLHLCMQNLTLFNHLYFLHVSKGYITCIIADAWIDKINQHFDLNYQNNCT